MTKNKKNQEFKIRKIRRNIEYSFRGSDRYFYLFIVFLVAGIVLWAVMHVIFDVCIDSWMLLTRNYLISSICGMF